MASTIVTKNSSTASAVPVTGDLTQGELAVNVTDKKLYTKDSGGTVVKLVGGLGNQEANAVAITGGSINGTTVGATTASTGAFTTLSASSTTTLSGGTANGVAYLNGSKVVTTGSALTFDGVNLATNTGGTNATLGINSTSSSVYLQSRPDISYSRLISSVYQLDFTTVANQPISFGVNNSEQMRLTSTGLGIGTSSPLSILTLLQSADGYDKGISITRAGANRGTIFLNASNDTLNFGRSTSTLMTLDLSGNLGLGVTPSAWATFKAMQIGNGTADTFIAVSGNQGDFGVNAYYNAGWKYQTSSVAASRYEQSSGVHQWFNAPSGTAGNAISFTQAATLTASGQFLVGTTSFDTSAPPDKGVSGGNFRSLTGGATVGASATATILTLSSTATGVYIVNANFGGQGNQIYGGVLIVVANAGSFRIVTNGGGSNSALSMSGANVQITNALGVPLDATATAIFIGNNA